MSAQQQQQQQQQHNRGPTTGAINELVDVSREWAHKLFRPETWYNLNMSLGLKRLQELIQGCTSSLTDDPVWLLGLWYGLQDVDTNKSSMTPELHQLLLDDLNSRFWFTYRRDFPPIGGSSLTSDVGWGCTLRSGQMLMAEAVARCWWGRSARFPAEDTPETTAHSQQQEAQQHQQLPSSSAGVAEQQARASPSSSAGGASTSSSSRGGLSVPDQQSLLQLFVDQPGPQAPFSLHNLCAAGAPHGVVAGQWLGPWVLCKALAAAAAASGSQQQGGLGLHVHVACDPGGGAPELDPVQLLQLLPASSGSDAGGTSSAAAAVRQQERQQLLGAQQKPQPQTQQGMLLLVPLTLGVGKVNERYPPQLSTILSFPQSVGIVGGRPGASLYFVGVQGGAVLYLDPHEVQEAPVLPRDSGSFHCSLPRLMPLSAIDPSLAIGFYCADTGELEDLLSRLQQLAATAGGAPLMTVQQPGRASSASDAAGAAAAGGAVGGSGSDVAAGGGGRADDWELV